MVPRNVMSTKDHIRCQAPIVVPFKSVYNPFRPSLGARMPRRKKSDVVQLKLRIREALRARLEAAARRNDESLNSEMARRLENSFLRAENDLLVRVLLAPHPFSLGVLRAVSAIFFAAGKDWDRSNEGRRKVEAAIHKVIDGIFGDPKRKDVYSLPKRDVAGSVDHLVWMASQWAAHRISEREEITGKAVPGGPAKEGDGE
jgi:hypothetical protein